MSKDLDENQDIKQEPPITVTDESVEVVEVDTELSKVASNPKRNMMILGVFVVIFAYILYQLFTSTTEPEKESKDPVIVKPDNIVKPALEQDSYIPPLPELPKIEAPQAPDPAPVIKKEEPAPVAAPSVTTPSAVPEIPVMPMMQPPASSEKATMVPSLPSILPSSSVEEQKRLDAKRKSSILLVSGAPEKETAIEAQMKADFTYRGSLSYVLGRGKMIDAIMESAINSDFPGEVVAIVSRDIYSENGKIVLIPKGSKVFGAFSGVNEDSGYGRIDITWTRIDLPSGYSLNLSGTTVDHLSRKGVQGRVDNKYKERFANAVLSSSLSMLIAAGLDKVIPPVATSTTTATQNSLSSSITSTATNAYTSNSSSTPDTQITAICNAVQALPSVVTSVGYSSIQTACSTAIGAGATATAATVSTLLSSITAAAGNLSVAAANSSTPSQQQTASQEAFKTLSDDVKDMLTKDNVYKPTITLNQGEHIKIYVNKDYNFPPKAVNQSRLIQ